MDGPTNYWAHSAPCSPALLLAGRRCFHNDVMIFTNRFVKVSPLPRRWWVGECEPPSFGMSAARKSTHTHTHTYRMTLHKSRRRVSFALKVHKIEQQSGEMFGIQNRFSRHDTFRHCDFFVTMRKGFLWVEASPYHHFKDLRLSLTT